MLQALLQQDGGILVVAVGEVATKKLPVQWGVDNFVVLI